MKEVFQFLIDLQEVDNTIHDIRERQNEIPNEINLVLENQKALEINLKEEKEKLIETEKRKRGFEIDLEAYNESLKKHQAQLHGVKTNKEYTALLHEIEDGKKKISSLEEDILFLIEEIENGIASIEEKEQKVETSKTETEKTQNELEIEKSTLDVGLEKREEGRNNILSRMDGPLLSQYERIRKGRQGHAIVEIQGSICGGCFTSLPPQTTVEIRIGEKLHLCENCGRILVWKGD